MDFNFNKFMEEYALEIGGQFSEYDKFKSVIIVPLSDNRFQAVLGMVKVNEKYDKMGIEFSSKVCPFSSEFDLKEMLEENAKTCYAKLVIVDDYIKVEGSTFIDNANDQGLKEIIQEVANVADEWEFRLTGKDIN